MKLEDSCLARRRFLCGMLGSGAAAMGAGVLVPFGQYAGNLHAAPLPDFVAVDPAQYDPPPGTAKMVLYGHLPVLLLRPAGAGAPLRAFLATCTHLNCTVTYDEAAARITCACHGGVFDTDGHVVSGPPPAPLTELHCKLHHGKLVLALEKENLEKAS